MILPNINTEKDYQDALNILEIIFDAEPNTLQGEELEKLVSMIEEYENKNFLSVDY